MVYENSHGRFVREGQVSGDRDKAERAARLAIAILGPCHQGNHRVTERAWLAVQTALVGVFASQAYDTGGGIQARPRHKRQIGGLGPVS